MNNKAMEFEKAKYLTEAKRIFADAENYTDTEIMSYANLTRAIFGIATFDTINDNDILISKLEESIHTLAPLETSTIILRYGLDDGMWKSRDIICRKLGYTRERIRQLEAKALRKLRHPSRVANFNVSRRNSQLRCEQARLANMASLSQDAGIEELDLSVRSYNCLLRAGITTIKQLLNTSDDEILKIRNIGESNYEELISCKKAFSSK